MLKLAVLVSGGGTNLQAIIDAISAGKITNACISVVISNNANAYALERARAHGIEALCISPKDFESREAFNQAFLDKYCVGYDEKTLPASAPKNGHYKAYILGEGPDGVAKTPEWASQITGVPADKIIKLAREIGSTKPAFISQGWGPQRHANGEIATRAISMLAILTGNVGINGGNSGAREGSYSLPFVRMPTLENPIQTSISMFMWTDAIERGPEMTALRDGVRGKDKLDVPELCR